MTQECVFCNIVSKKQPTELLFENENFVIIKDIKPACDFHYLAIPKRHIRDGRNLQMTDKPLCKCIGKSLDDPSGRVKFLCSRILKISLTKNRRIR